MKIAKQTFVTLAAFLIFPLIAFGQAQSITEKNFYALWETAETKTQKQIRKVTTVQKLYTDGKLDGTLKSTSEEIPPDKYKWISVEEKEGAVVSKIEEIRLGKFIYRRENGGAWVKRGSDEQEGIRMIGKDGNTRKFFAEIQTVGEKKFQVLIENKVNSDSTYFDERKIWIDAAGLLFKETATTAFKDLKNIVSAVETIYDYSSKPPKITVPMK